MSPIPDAERVDRLVDRWPAVRPFLFVGALYVVAGGLVAAVTRPTGFDLGSWLAAFLVLVGGATQIALGVGQAWLSDVRPNPAAVTAEMLVWNAGVAATIMGTLVAAPLVTTLGGIALIVALVLFLRGVGTSGWDARSVRTVYRAVVALILLSTPVGLALAWIRHG